MLWLVWVRRGGGDGFSGLSNLLQRFLVSLFLSVGACVCGRGGKGVVSDVYLAGWGPLWLSVSYVIGAVYCMACVGLVDVLMSVLCAVCVGFICACC